MYKNKTFLGIIPARGGSKGLPGKNIKELCGKPLIAWSIESGLKSKYLDEVMITTDSKDIADIAKQYGANVPFLRPDALASDTATSFDAIKHTIEFYKNEFDKEFDYIVLLEPTSPLREEGDIDKMIEKIIKDEDNFDSIVSIGEVAEHPSIMKQIVSENNILPFCIELEQTARRQDNKKAYFPYGVAYIVKTKSLLEEKTFYTDRNTFYEIKRYQCYEIDDIYDFLAIENIMKYEWSLK
ncbi:acylneuraminate cytidylyltransferase family protein [Aliarcobacter butzleri]|uniref:acylneuraminate cytidylyltransferase family protein n=1 Tax=Aliarcobacter butzleri TaxID=28197 RepID=UPI00263DC4AE|nr:acylneuraminate cytidylyltransferase family protein [Aliarcobacter butzleri]MDN5067873.1 acylneuraminate cytidylyltransferase family protein [Aliarcobacter butzleri]MDN5072725.1 acylneuraminate cytidylyltransferase family protein [Aliarcobacter butzleri]MDN5121703.1 acylneuraminate cytidylyltransferase family protein [Aliarcobacter butzleri]